MAAADKSNFTGSSLRILAIAHATGRMSREAYLRERTRQLGAIEFNKPSPPLPDELSNITIPTIKIDASYVNAHKKGGAKKKIILLLIAVLLLGSTAAGLWYGGFFAAKEKPQAQLRQPKLNEVADRLLHNPNWSERDITAFLRLWSTHSATAREQARNSLWYLKLDNEIIKRINQAKLRQSGGAVLSPAEQRTLDLLRAFQSQLSSN